MQRNVRDVEGFRGVRKESQVYSNEVCSHLKIQDVARREKESKKVRNECIANSGNLCHDVHAVSTIAGPACDWDGPRVSPRHQAVNGWNPVTAAAAE